MYYDKTINRPMRSKVYLVCGAPASGKTTYVKQHGEMSTFTMERRGVMKAYRNVIEVLHLTEVYEHFEQELNTALPETGREQ